MCVEPLVEPRSRVPQGSTVSPSQNKASCIRKWNPVEPLSRVPPRVPLVYHNDFVMFTSVKWNP